MFQDFWTLIHQGLTVISKNANEVYISSVPMGSVIECKGKVMFKYLYNKTPHRSSVL